MITPCKFVSLDISKHIPKINVNWKGHNMDYILYNSAIQIKCTKYNPLIIKDGDELPHIYNVLIEQLMLKFSVHKKHP